MNYFAGIETEFAIIHEKIPGQGETFVIECLASEFLYHFMVNRGKNYSANGFISLEYEQFLRFPNNAADSSIHTVDPTFLPLFSLPQRQYKLSVLQRE